MSFKGKVGFGRGTNANLHTCTQTGRATRLSLSPIRPTGRGTEGGAEEKLESLKRAGGDPAFARSCNPAPPDYSLLRDYPKRRSVPHLFFFFSFSRGVDLASDPDFLDFFADNFDTSPLKKPTAFVPLVKCLDSLFRFKCFPFTFMKILFFFHELDAAWLSVVLLQNGVASRTGAFLSRAGDETNCTPTTFFFKRLDSCNPGLWEHTNQQNSVDQFPAQYHLSQMRKRKLCKKKIKNMRRGAL